MQGRVWMASALTAALVALAACGQGGGPTGPANNAASPATNAAAPANVAAPASNTATNTAGPATNAATNSVAGPTPSETPAQFVARLFALYASDSPYWKAEPGSAAAARYQADYYDPSWSKLVDDNSTLAGKAGDEDLDYDPVCQCQDSGGHYAYISSAPGADGLVDVKVKSTENDTPPWTIVLKAEPGGWRVYDVIDTSGDLRVWIARHNACMRRIDPANDVALTACYGGPN